MSRSAEIESAGRALKAYEEALNWRNGHMKLLDPNPRVLLGWGAGSSVAGYGVLKDVIQQIVEDRFGDYLNLAVERLRLEANAKLADVGLPPVLKSL